MRMIYCNRTSLSGKALSPYQVERDITVWRFPLTIHKTRDEGQFATSHCSAVRSSRKLSQSTHTALCLAQTKLHKNSYEDVRLSRLRVYWASFRRHSDNVGSSAPWNVSQYPPNYKEKHSDWCFGYFPKFLKAEVRMWPSNKQQPCMSISLFITITLLVRSCINSSADTASLNNLRINHLSKDALCGLEGMFTACFVAITCWPHRKPDSALWSRRHFNAHKTHTVLP